jgi:Domain of unknown function (DUF4410)
LITSSIIRLVEANRKQDGSIVCSKTHRPAIVYVEDFKTEKKSADGDQQSLGAGRARALIAQAKSATGMQSSQMVDLMLSSLVSDLNRGGVRAQRLTAGEPRPKTGWLVRGIFTEVDQGSRVLRSQAGFRRDLPKNIRQTAQTVADQIVRRAK